MDRLIAFYERIFEARVTLDREEQDALRHAFIEIGPHTVLHPFEVRGVDVPGRQPILELGRLAHFALNATNEEALREIRRVARGHVGEAGVPSRRVSLLPASGR